MDYRSSMFKPRPVLHYLLLKIKCEKTYKTSKMCGLENFHYLSLKKLDSNNENNYDNENNIS